jgi:hypothetical protein
MEEVLMASPNENPQLGRLYNDRLTPIHRQHDMLTTLEALQPKRHDYIGSEIRIIVGTRRVVQCDRNLAEPCVIDAIRTHCSISFEIAG